jgi:transglutaminase-like putative cysteine protease
VGVNIQRRFRRVALVVLFYSSSAHAAIDPQPKRGPIPDWVKPVTIPAPDPALKEESAQVLLLNGQTRMKGSGESSYFEMVIVPQTVAGLQGSGTLTLPWNVARTNMTINAVSIIRDGTTIDLLKDAQFTVLHRENDLERARFDGTRTVVLPVKGLQIGDVLRVAATYDQKSGQDFGAPETLSEWDAPFNAVLFDQRIMVDKALDMKWRVSGSAPQPVVTSGPTQTEYRFVSTKVKPPKYPAFMRWRDKTSDVQFTSYASWSDVAKTSVPMYAKARALDAGTSLAAEADKIARSTSDPHARMMAALRLTQERVRYVALLLGEGAYVPVDAQSTWDSKYGDCKAKSAMLLALLDRLGIKSEALYVNAAKGDVLADRLPSLATFDHVIVKAQIGVNTYFLDGTDYGQRTIGDVSASPYSYGLAISAGATLEKLPDFVATAPIVDLETVWDASKGVTGAVPFAIRLTLRGVKAVEARSTKASGVTKEKYENYLKSLIPGISNDLLTISDHRDLEGNGEIVVELKGKSDLDWGEYQDRKGLRFAFGNGTSKWNPDFERDEGKYKESRITLNPAYWMRETERLILPATKGYRIDDPTPIDTTVAGTRIWRTVKPEVNGFSAETHFKQVSADISAADSRAAKPVLEKINENWAYIVAPRSFKLPKTKD